MKPRKFAALLVLLATGLAVHPTDLVLHDAPVQVYFSPNGGCTEAIVETIQAAHHSILVAMYSLTSAPIAKALVDAKNHGVDVRVILDRSQLMERYSGLTFLQHAGVPVWVDSTHAILHDKYMICDGVTVTCGSMNWTRAGEEKNGENLLIIKDQGLAKIYAQNWDLHLRHSERQ